MIQNGLLRWRGHNRCIDVVGGSVNITTHAYHQQQHCNTQHVHLHVHDTRTAVHAYVCVS
jgi:hypothetical protein